MSAIPKTWTWCRCPGAITRDRLEAVRESDAILREEFAKNGLDEKVWQYFTVVPEFKSTNPNLYAILIKS